MVIEVCPKCFGIGKGMTNTGDPFMPLKPIVCPRCGGGGSIDKELEGRR